MMERDRIEGALTRLGEEVRDAAVRPLSPEMLRELRRLTAALSSTLDEAAQLPLAVPRLRLVD